MTTEMVNDIPRVVLDTNIIVSALLFGGNSKKIIENLSKRKFKAYTSPRLIYELIDVLIKKFKFNKEKIMLLEAEIIKLFTIVYPTKAVKIVRDEKDDMVLEVALESKSNIVVTGDKDLLVLEKFKNTIILTPKMFLETYL